MQDAAEAIPDADSAGDDVLKASLHLEMIDLLAGLRERHRDQPVLLETMADYLEDAAQRPHCTGGRMEIAEVHGLPTRSDGPFARLLVDIGEPVAALQELHACGNEAACGNEDERTDWADMLEDVAYDTEGNDERIPLYQHAIEIAHGTRAAGRLPHPTVVGPISGYRRIGSRARGTPSIRRRARATRTTGRGGRDCSRRQSTAGLNPAVRQNCHSSSSSASPSTSSFT